MSPHVTPLRGSLAEIWNNNELSYRAANQNPSPKATPTNAHRTASEQHQLRNETGVAPRAMRTPILRCATRKAITP
jgi:hypothetical protein